MSDDLEKPQKGRCLNPGSAYYKVLHTGPRVVVVVVVDVRLLLLLLPAYLQLYT